jgi:hypothetical protein
MSPAGLGTKIDSAGEDYQQSATSEHHTTTTDHWADREK